MEQTQKETKKTPSKTATKRKLEQELQSKKIDVLTKIVDLYKERDSTGNNASTFANLSTLYYNLGQLDNKLDK
jgi:hypothetical protein